MMKRFVRLIACALILALAAASFAACGSALPPETDPEIPESGTESAGTPEKPSVSVKHPMKEIPNYALPEGASLEEVRATAVRAMRDELSVEWVTDSTILYNKSVSKTDRDFELSAGRVYAGLPYTAAASGLLSWLQYYDFETGAFSERENA